MRTIFRRINGTSKRRLISFLFFFIGEFLLIFIGVTLSLQFSNWNDSRRKTREEIQILEQLRTSFKMDLEEVNSNRQARSMAKKACQTVLQLGDNVVAYHDSLDAIFGAAYEIRTTLNETSPYENLKSKGFDLISNDTLRLSIIDMTAGTPTFMSLKIYTAIFFLIRWFNLIPRVSTPPTPRAI